MNETEEPETKTEPEEGMTVQGFKNMTIPDVRCDCGRPTCSKRRLSVPLGCKCANDLPSPYFMEIDPENGVLTTWCARCHTQGPSLPIGMEDRPITELVNSTMKAMFNGFKNAMEAHKSVSAWAGQATKGDA
jgi:hypothetical protein